MFSQSQFNTLAAVNPYYLTKYVRVVRNVSLTIQAAPLVSETTFTMLQSVIYNIPFYNINDYNYGTLIMRDIQLIEIKTHALHIAQLVSQDPSHKLIHLVLMLLYINNQDAYDIIASSNYWDDIHYGDVTYTNYVSNPLPVVIEC
ncbi:unnamed protein product [Adineta steineri]|uniref:Uncharacterized protein n=1 Tax=Adineta steineri TaxID=433720 RepID=A0A819HCZ6_9BILA|nr:unnamed protein product [Adineta steineri]